MAIFSWTKSKKSRAFLEFWPYSAYNFGGRNRKPKAENFPFRPKVSASGIPLPYLHLLCSNLPSFNHLAVIISWEGQGEYKLGMMNIISSYVSLGTESILPWVQKHCLWLFESIEHVPCPQTAKLLWPSQTSCFSVQWTPNQLFRQWHLYK